MSSNLHANKPVGSPNQQTRQRKHDFCSIPPNHHPFSSSSSPYYVLAAISQCVLAVMLEDETRGTANERQLASVGDSN
jgi:hypothetical protein